MNKILSFFRIFDRSTVIVYWAGAIMISEWVANLEIQERAPELHQSQDWLSPFAATLLAFAAIYCGLILLVQALLAIVVRIKQS